MSIHIAAKVGEIAETVLLPGDPKRAKWIAENYLENSFCYTDIRGMLGFTGTYKGKRISVQGTGMGIPSISIYITELMKDYGVKNLIRVGSAGSYQKDIKVRDIVIPMSASTDSNINNRRFNGANFSPTVNFELFSLTLKVAVLAVEMETAGLYTLAAKYKAKALSILTISDSLVSPEITSAEEREKTFSEMIELALEIATRM